MRDIALAHSPPPLLLYWLIVISREWPHNCGFVLKVTHSSRHGSICKRLSKLFEFHFRKLELQTLLQTCLCHLLEGTVSVLKQYTVFMYDVYSSAELQSSFVEMSSSRYSLEPYGLVQPLQVREILKTSRDHGEYNGREI